MQLTHHAMIVGDMDHAIKIYCGNLGMRLLRRKPGVAYKEIAMIEDMRTGRRIELLLEEGCTQSRLDHIAFEVEDVDQAFERLKGEGFTMEREPFDVLGSGVRTSFLRAPDGVKIEIIRYGAAPSQGT